MSAPVLIRFVTCLCIVGGRGPACYNHVGNQRFRLMVDDALDKYVGKLKLEKTLIICELVQRVREASPVGGFVKKDDATGRYYEVGDHFAREKTSQVRGLCLVSCCFSQFFAIQSLRDAMQEKFKRSDAPKKKRDLERSGSDQTFAKKKSRTSSSYREDRSNYQEASADQRAQSNARFIADSQTSPWRQSAGVTKSCPNFSSSGESALLGESGDHHEPNWPWPMSPRAANALGGKVVYGDEHPQVKAKPTQGNQAQASPVVSCVQPASLQILEGVPFASVVSVAGQGPRISTNFQPALGRFLQLGIASGPSSTMDCVLPFSAARLDTMEMKAEKVAVSPPQPDRIDQGQDDLFEKLVYLTKDCSTTGNPFDPRPIWKTRRDHSSEAT